VKKLHAKIHGTTKNSTYVMYARITSDYCELLVATLLSASRARTNSCRMLRCRLYAITGGCTMFGRADDSGDLVCDRARPCKVQIERSSSLLSLFLYFLVKCDHRVSCSSTTSECTALSCSIQRSPGLTRLRLNHFRVEPCTWWRFIDLHCAFAVAHCILIDTAIDWERIRNDVTHTSQLKSRKTCCIEN